ncbi:hypothetical protein BCV69DRAFT_134075 [Microstroma glucosiphilum]|uniref:Uncharacterized protein n=1 Tax=Pseudomicrostroma glucosiphilum TaxID=1684307 RepID=A0A316UCG6_9BASI|nr:hypothetical protein BCV69DRAFT_134075 [Pseudomicrostroma glucosiphilum]PWN22141.1 hypothetical protein BCV69DRAFT_134075 [Pseudomicrostroma glucosiphilum]
MLFKHFAILASLAASALAMPFGEVSGLDAAEKRSLEVRGGHSSSGFDLDIDADIILGNSMKPTCYGEWVKHPKHHKKVWKPKSYCSLSIDLSLHEESSYCFKWGGCCAKKREYESSTGKLVIDEASTDIEHPPSSKRPRLHRGRPQVQGQMRGCRRRLLVRLTSLMALHPCHHGCSSE